MTNFEIVYAKYIMSLVKNNTTAEIRNAVLDPSITYGKDDAFSQVLVCFMNLMVLQNLDVDTIMERIETEYNALNMQETMGDYSQYAEFIRACAIEMRKGSTYMDSAYAIAENIEDYCDLIQYSVAAALLKRLVFAKKIISDLETVEKMLAFTDIYTDEPEGYISISSLCETVINNTTAID